MAKLMLIDGNSLTYRAFFALPTDITTASGQVTNAVFGFTSMLLNLVRDHQPDGIGRRLRPARADVPPRGGRRRTRPTATRRPTSCASRWAWCARWSTRCASRSIEAPGFEADDIIATLADPGARPRATRSIIVTGDRDTYQLVEDPHIKVLYNQRGVSDYALYDEAGIEERTGVRADAVPAVRRAAGRSVRQPAGRARGGGEDRGQAHQHLRRPRRHLRPRRRADAEAARRTSPSTRRQVRRNVEVMVLRPRRPARGRRPTTCVRASSTPRRCASCSTSSSSASLLDRLAEAFGDAVGRAGRRGGRRCSRPRSTDARRPPRRAALLDGAARGARARRGRGAWDGPSRPQPARSASRSSSTPTAAEVAWIPGASLGDVGGRALARGRSGRRGRAAHDAKPLMRSLLDRRHRPARRSRLDTELAAYLLDPAEHALRARRPARCATRDARAADGRAPRPEGQLDLGGDGGRRVAARRRRRALAVAALVGAARGGARRAGHAPRSTTTIEIPLVRVLARMEHVGVGVDVDELQQLNDR